MPSREPALSVVIPVRDEAGSIAAVADEVAAALAGGGPYEIIVVDDGSRDATPGRLREILARGELPLRVLRHPRPLGQSAALRSGIAAARAEWVATLDGDGQNDPADIPRLQGALHTRSDPRDLRLVCGARLQRRDAWTRRVASRIADAARQLVLADATPDAGCGLKLIHRATFLELPFFDHQHRFLPALVSHAGWQVVSLPVSHRPRASGRSKYGLVARLLAGLVDLAGVRWLLRRSPRGVAVELRAEDGSGA